MLDLKYIRENAEFVKQGALNKNEKCDIDRVIDLDEQRRSILHQVEDLKSQRNKASAEIAKLKKAGESADDQVAEMRKVGEQISEFDNNLRNIDEELNSLLSWIPNLPHESVPIGKDESANKFIREYGEIPKRSFKVLPHWEIGENLDILDLAGASKISGSGYYVLKNEGARLQRALINYMLDMHTDDGFKELVVPYLVTADTMFGTGQLPKLAEDMYQTDQGETFLIPTAEVPVTNLYKDQIIDAQQLPIYMVAHTPCFRREAGTYGQDTKGMIRVHQFDKVELVKIVKPENSYDELETLVSQAEKVLQGLKLPYRVMALASGDLSFAAAKCYDIELYSAGVERYLEISSVSNFEDFQARRMRCRYKETDSKPQFPHTLNGSGVALARLIPAILENYQNENGTVTVPEALRPYMKGMEQIG